MKYILALDLGTTSSRAVLVNHNGNIKGIAHKELRSFFPSPGWVEQDPKEIWNTGMQAILDVLAETNVKPEQIAAIGISNQRETTIVWEKKSGKPIYPAIVWQDRRTASYCQELKNQGLEGVFHKKTGLLLDPYFSGTKLRWILQHVPGSFERARRGELAFGTVNTWLTWKLTEGACYLTDMTNASRTLLFNLHTKNWDQELLDLLQIPKEILPEIRSSSEIYGQAKILESSLPIAGMAGDQQAALIGQSCLQPGMTKNTYGTGCFLLMNTGKKAIFSSKNLLTTVAVSLPGHIEYGLEGSVFIGGAAIQWLQTQLKLANSLEEIEKLAGSVADSGGVYFVPAFAGLGAPYWNPYARGMILGISRGTSAAHIARAALEGIAYQVIDLIKSMEADTQVPLQELRVDGGAAVNHLLMQCQADLLGVPVIRPKNLELSAMGAAYLAGLPVGFWESPSHLKTHWSADKKFEPATNPEKAIKSYQKWQKAVEIAQSWEEKGL